MNASKQSRRKSGPKKLEPIDWHEFANDAVLNGNMSTLYRRPPAEDSTAYASPEALVEIEKRVGRPAQSAVVVELEAIASDDPIKPTVGQEPPVGATPTVLKPSPESQVDPHEIAVPTVGISQTVGLAFDQDPRSEPDAPTAGSEPTVGLNTGDVQPATSGAAASSPTVGAEPIVRTEPTAGLTPAVGLAPGQTIRPIRDVHDALTLAGQVLYKAMYGGAEGLNSRTCTKGYRQLAAETRLDKDTVRDLIREFKDRGIVRQTGTYDPDTRSSKSYEILSRDTILQSWREAGILFVTAGRRRPVFCTAEGKPLAFRPTVGMGST
jgi:hypothetical protein